MNKQIIIASNNSGKIKEFKEILDEYELISMHQAGLNIEVEENEETFIGNAIKKAVTISNNMNGKMCIADDSGIEIEYLNGFPGVQTKRWKKGTDRQRNMEILDKMKGVPKEKRKVSFVTAIALASGNDVITSQARLDGYVSEFPRGDNGFGFDEIFELQDGKTLAELSLEEKNEISARKKAILKLYENLKTLGNVSIY